MTREQAIKELKCYHREDGTVPEEITMAIKALEQNESAEEWYKLFVEKLDEQEPCDKCVYSTKDGYCQYDDISETIPPLEPCTDAVSRGVFEQVMFERDIAIEQLHELGYEFGQKIEPCDDAISRDAVLRIIDGWYEQNRETENIEDLIILITYMASVNPQKSGKWDRLYNWLNDMRYCIAPDETVTDIDERNCRESQTDIIDEIMEWMIKAESEE